MNKRAYGLGVLHGYNGVPYGNPYVTNEDSDDYDEGYDFGAEMREEEEDEV